MVERGLGWKGVLLRAQEGNTPLGLVNALVPNARHRLDQECLPSLSAKNIGATPFNPSQEIYDYRCLDGKVDILGNRYPQQGLSADPLRLQQRPQTCRAEGHRYFPAGLALEVCKTLVSSFGPAKEVTLPTV